MYSPKGTYQTTSKPDEYGKYRHEGEAPVIAVSPAEEGKLDISLPKGTNYIDLSGEPVAVTGKKGVSSYPTGYKALGGGAQLVGPSIGYTAKANKDLRFSDGSFIRQGGIINPGKYSEVDLADVTLLPGVFGSTKELQYKSGQGSQAGQYVNPNIISQKIFVPQQRVPDFFNNADAIMKEKGLKLNAEMSKLKKQYEGMFGGGKNKSTTQATLPGWPTGSQKSK
jgi:hypothetical protein